MSQSFHHNSQQVHQIAKKNLKELRRSKYFRNMVENYSHKIKHAQEAKKIF